MKPPQQILALCLALAAAATADAPKSVVRFSNNDVLAGFQQALTPQHLIWNSPLLERPATFLLDKVLDVSQSPAPPNEIADHVAMVTLTNGDAIRGQLASVTDDTIALDTWFAGRMSFRRPMVSGVKIEQRTGFLYSGPSGLDGWHQSAKPPAWTYSRSAFRASAEGGIARNDLLPEECSVSFDAAWKGDSIRLRVVLCSDDSSTDNPNSGYDFSFVRGSVHARNCRTQSFLGSAQSQALVEADKVHVEIKVSKKTSRVALFINGRIIDVWNDPDAGQAAFGRGLHFISGSTLPLRVSDIRVAAWDGVIEQMPEPRPGFNRRFGFPELNEDDEESEPDKKPEPESRMELANGDSLAGEVSSIENGVITMKTPLGEIRLPVSRLRTVLLKPMEPESSKRYNGDIRAWFPDGGSIVFRLESSGDGTLTGTSQNFGTATFQTAAFSRIEFNIYSPDYEDMRRAEDW
jgi:hypothetical protein